jgi:hypothetical protein
MSVVLANYHFGQNSEGNKVGRGGTSRRVASAGFMMRARRGMFGTIRREQQASGLEARSMGFRRDINGSGIVLGLTSGTCAACDAMDSEDDERKESI